jgi:hypothetical protein
MRSLLRLLHKDSDNHNPLTFEGDVNRSGNSVFSRNPKLPEFVAKGFDSVCWDIQKAILANNVGHPREPGSKIRAQLRLFVGSFRQKLNGPHSQHLAKTLSSVKFEMHRFRHGERAFPSQCPSQLLQLPLKRRIKRRLVTPKSPSPRPRPASATPAPASSS